MPRIRDRTEDGRDLLPDTFVAAVEAVLPKAANPAIHEQIFAFLSELPLKPLPDWLRSIYREIRDRCGAV